MIPPKGASKGSSLACGFRRGPCRYRWVGSVLLRLMFLEDSCLNLATHSGVDGETRVSSLFDIGRAIHLNQNPERHCSALTLLFMELLCTSINLQLSVK